MSIEIGGFFPWDRPVASCRPSSSQRDRVSDSNTIRDSDLLCFSGRTALTLIVDWLKSNQLSQSKLVAYVPNYICESVIWPLEFAGFQVTTYEVILTPDSGFEYLIDIDFPCDLFLAMSYFGYSASNMDSWIREFKRRGVVVVEDLTHRFLSRTEAPSEANFQFASVRKWLGVASGAIVRGIDPEFGRTKIAESPNIDSGDRAMRLKAGYLKRGEELPFLKANFLDLYRRYQQIFNEDYIGKEIDRRSASILQRTDFDQIRYQRGVNARFLVEECAQLGFNLGPANSPNWDVDCPLFVPLFVDPALRGRIVEDLIQARIFAPVHWPIPSMLRDRPELERSLISPFSTEISLPCDQRYSLQDMERVVSRLKEWMR